MNDCIHWNGVQHDCCKAGVNYAKLAGQTFALVRFLPCHDFSAIKFKGGAKYEPVQCEKLQRLSDAQVKQKDQEMDEAFARITLVMDAIQPWRNAPPRGKQTVMECPICKGHLHLSQASNGHVWGRCETEGCVRWVE